MIIDYTKDISTATDAINIYNLIRDTEDRLAAGEIIENLDIDAMNAAKALAKKVIEKTLHIAVA